MAVNGKLEIIKPLYVTIAQSKKEHQALLKKYVKRVGALKDRGYPMLKTPKAAATSSLRNCTTTLPQPQHKSAYII